MTVVHDDAPRAAELYLQALAAGCAGKGKPIGVGRQSAAAWVAKAAGWDLQAARRRVEVAFELGLIRTERQPDFTVPPLPDKDESAEALIARRIERHGQITEARAARRLIKIPVAIDGPFGILHMGDPHVDDDGCDWATLRAHIALANRTKGLLAGNVGDVTNNWIGRLARLYGHQETTQRQAWKLAEWFMQSVPWLYILGGNHDVWSGDGDPLQWMSRQAGVLYEHHGARLGLQLPGGRELRINARHDFRGHSQWNPVHGINKAAMLGPSDHIYIAGHKHVAGLNWHKQSDGVWSSAIRVGTYKVFDEYADASGFPDHNLPAVVTIIRPDADEAGFVEVFKDVDFAADWLTFARKRFEAGRRIGRAA